MRDEFWQRLWPGIKSLVFFALVMVAVLWLTSDHCWAQEGPWKLPDVTIDGKKVSEPAKVSTVMQIGFAMTTLSLAPTLLVLCTAFTRVTITMSFIRQALGTQQVPPTQVIMGLGLFLTMYIMAPVSREMNQKAVQPWIRNEIGQTEFAEKLFTPLREFMLRQTRDKDLILFAQMSRTAVVEKRIQLPMYVICPAYILSEIKTAFEIGFLLYIPFLVVDMIVSSILMAGGMHMLSPGTISLPFKLLLFVLIDGWDLIMTGLIKSFNTEKV